MTNYPNNSGLINNDNLGIFTNKSVNLTNQTITALQAANITTLASNSMYMPCYNLARFLGNKIKRSVIFNANSIEEQSVVQSHDVFRDFDSSTNSIIDVGLTEKGKGLEGFPTTNNVSFTFAKRYIKLQPAYYPSPNVSDGTNIVAPSRDFKQLFFSVIDYTQRSLAVTTKPLAANFTLQNAYNYNPVYDGSLAMLIQMDIAAAMRADIDIGEGGGSKALDQLHFLLKYQGADTINADARKGAMYDRIYRTIENRIIRANGLNAVSYQQSQDIIQAGMEDVFKELRSKGNHNDANTSSAAFQNTALNSAKISTAASLVNIDLMNSLVQGLTTMGYIDGSKYIGTHSSARGSEPSTANEPSLMDSATQYNNVDRNFFVGMGCQAITSASTMTYSNMTVLSRQISLQNNLKDKIYSVGYLNDFYSDSVFIIQNSNLLQENYHINDSKQSLALAPMATNSTTIFANLAGIVATAGTAYNVSGLKLRNNVSSPDYSIACGLSRPLFWVYTDSNGMHNPIMTDNGAYNPGTQFQGGFKWIGNFMFVLQPNSYNNVTGLANYIMSPYNLQLACMNGTVGTPAQQMATNQIVNIAGAATDYLPQAQDNLGNPVIVQGAQTLQYQNRTLNQFFVGLNKSNAIDPFFSNKVPTIGGYQTNNSISLNIWNASYSRPDQYAHFTVIGVNQGVSDGIKRNLMYQNIVDPDWKKRYVDIETDGVTVHVKSGANPITIFGVQANNEYDVINSLTSITYDMVFFQEFSSSVTSLNPMCGIQSFGPNKNTAAGTTNLGALTKIPAGLVYNLKAYILKIAKGTKLSFGKREWMIDVVTGSPIPLKGIEKIPSVRNVLYPESNTFIEGSLQTDVVIFLDAAGDYISGRAPESQTVQGSYLGTTFMSNCGISNYSVPQQTYPISSSVVTSPNLLGVVSGAGAHQIGCGLLGYTNFQTVCSSATVIGAVTVSGQTSNSVSHWYFTPYSSSWNGIVNQLPSFSSSRGFLDDAIDIYSFPLLFEIQGRTDQDIYQDNVLATVRPARSRSGIYHDVIEQPINNNIDISFIVNQYADNSVLLGKLPSITGGSNAVIGGGYTFQNTPVPIGFFNTNDAQSYGFSANMIALDPVSGQYKITMETIMQYNLLNIVPDRFFNNSYAWLLLYGNNNKDPLSVAYPDYTQYQAQTLGLAMDINTFPSGYSLVNINANSPIVTSNLGTINAPGVAHTYSTIAVGIDGAAERFIVTPSGSDLSNGKSGIAMMNGNTSTFLENKTMTEREMLNVVDSNPAASIQYEDGLNGLPSEHRWVEKWTTAQQTGQTIQTLQNGFVLFQNISLPATDSSMIINTFLNKMYRNVQLVKNTSGYIRSIGSLDLSSGSDRLCNSFDNSLHYKRFKDSSSKIGTSLVSEDDVKKIIERCIVNGMYKYMALTTDIKNYEECLSISAISECLPNFEYNKKEGWVQKSKEYIFNASEHLAALYKNREALKGTIVGSLIFDIINNKWDNEHLYECKPEVLENVVDATAKAKKNSPKAESIEDLDKKLKSLKEGN